MNASSIQRQQLANNLNISNEQNNRSSSARNVGSTDSEPSNNLSVLSNQSHLKRSESVDSIYHGPYIIIYPADISEDDFLERLSVYLKSAEHSIFSSVLMEEDYYVLGLTDKLSVLIEEVVNVLKNDILLPESKLEAYRKLWSELNPETAPVVLPRASYKQE